MTTNLTKIDDFKVKETITKQIVHRKEDLLNQKQQALQMISEIDQRLAVFESPKE